MAHQETESDGGEQAFLVNELFAANDNLMELGTMQLNAVLDGNVGAEMYARLGMLEAQEAIDSAISDLLNQG